MRKEHIIGGLVTFGIGLFLAYAYSVYVVEFIKGAIQPVTIILGLLALAAAIFHNNAFRKINYGVAAIFLIVGFYGLYDEYYAVMDLLYGIFPIALFAGGITAVVHGIQSVK
ncbi:magnetosome protein MamI-2 [Candidatus Magnetomorum sp. HK-1]|nr:magnetosome protein MamI-2 [Candidatus Magnetomorum sp. HK-1]